jgi:hypothetical protein
MVSGGAVRVAIASIYSPGYSGLQAITEPGKRAYCERHGYTPEFCEVPVVDGFTGYEYVESLLPKYDVVFKIDVDALIMNPTLPVDRLAEQPGWRIGDTDQFYMGFAPGLVITTDFKSINDGQIIFVNCQMTRSFLRAFNEDGMARSFFGSHIFSSQEALAAFTSRPPYSTEPGWLKVVPQRAMNSYRQDLYVNADGSPKRDPRVVGGQYEDGDWICHLAGFPYVEKCRLAAEMAAHAVELLK